MYVPVLFILVPEKGNVILFLAPEGSGSDSDMGSRIASTTPPHDLPPALGWWRTQ